tara:strand:+ start:3062 stop:4093 length:1032 start_codon:yes stop_codon:yes gene_type:complete
VEKFNNIYNSVSFDKLNEERKMPLDKYLQGLSDLESAARDEKNPLVTSGALKDYYNRAMQIGNKSKHFDNKLRKKINKINKELANLGSGKKTNEIIADNIALILKEIENKDKLGIFNENDFSATPGSINGMGAVEIPEVGGNKLGSGDVFGGTADDEVSVQEPAKTISMKKFKKIKEDKVLSEKEIYIPIKDFGDPATLIQILATELSKRNSEDFSSIVPELTNLHISYNGLVDIKSLDTISRILDTDTKSLKKKIDKIVSKNIEVLENLQIELLTKILTEPETLNEGILGRALGGIAGFAVGPKIGKAIAKVLGIEKGPLFNVLTSRIVSAALAQELTKKLF